MRQLPIKPICIGVLSLLATGALAQDRGEALFNQRCAACHGQTSNIERAPHLEELSNISADTIVIALTRGSMTAQAQGLSGEDIAAIATHLTGEAPSITGATNITVTNACANAEGNFASNPDNEWQGWGNGFANHRFQPTPGLSAADIAKLKPKWVFGLPGDGAYGQATVVGGRVFVTSFAGHVFALDADTGCTHWAYDAGAPSRPAISVAKVGERWLAMIGDDKAYVHGLDALTGEPLWKTRLDDHPVARITGSPQYYQGKLLVTVSSVEEGVGTQASYGCCTFRGSVAALDARNGKLLWQSYAIPEAPAPLRKNASGVQQFGPAGAAIWMAPTIDTKRNRLYVGTGNSYTEMDSEYSNAIIAFDIETGERVWHQQVTPGDNYLVGCRGTRRNDNNCPDEAGPDHDFGASPVLLTLPDGRDVIFAGQKSGMVYAMDVDKQGEVIWKQQVHPGSPLGGVQWGMSTDQTHLYVSNALRFPIPNSEMGGLTALSLTDGKTVWHTPAPANECSWGRQGCSPAQSQAVTSMPGIVLSGTLDGYLRAYDSDDGNVLWEFNTAVEFDSVNGVATVGGSLDAGGPTVANGTVYLLSGYGRLGGHGGNALIAFTVDGK